MKNNKGFTVVEVIVSFVLVSTISIILLQLILSLKEVYLSGDIKTTLLNKQGIMTKKIYEELNSKELTSINKCGLSCLEFGYDDESSSKLLVDPGNNTITFGDYTLKLHDSSYFGQITVETDTVESNSNDKDDSILTINIPVYSKLLDDEDFGFNIIKTYNSSNITIDTTYTTDNISSIPLTLSGIETNLYLLTDTEDNSAEGLFAKVFHQKSTKTFAPNAENEDFIKYNGTDLMSTLTSLEAFRTKRNLSAYDDDDEYKTVAKQNGYLSFLLVYDEEFGNAYSWYQTSNFANKESIAGFVPFDAPNGLTYNNDSSEKYFANILGKKTNIGIISGGTLKNNGNNANEVDLYVEAEEYLCKYAMTTIIYNGDNIKNLYLKDGKKLCIEE